MTDVEIRPATMADRAGVQRVARAGWHAAYDDIIGPEQVDGTVDSWYDPEALTVDVQRDRRPFFVAVDDGDVVGFAEGAPVDGRGGEDAGGGDAAADGDAGEGPAVYDLYRIYVDPGYWGEGLGTRLLDRLEAALRDRDVRRLQLTVFAENEGAVGFYEARGFERVAEEYDDEFDADRYEYAKEL